MDYESRYFWESLPIQEVIYSALGPIGISEYYPYTITMTITYDESK